MTSIHEAILSIHTPAHSTAMKARAIADCFRYEFTGFVMTRLDGQAVIVASGAVRWLSVADLDAIMQPEQRDST